MNLTYSYATDVGRVRPHNEDAVHIFENNETLVMVVADGMGGHASGDVASQMAIEQVKQLFSDDLYFKSKEAAGVWISQILEQVNDNILTYAAKHNARNMGTTLVMAVITKTFVVVANIGDSRAYVLAFDKLRQITKDHTFVRELVEKGQISERAAKVHPNKNVINKALGANALLEFDLLTIEHYDIEAILLCTDGLTGLIEDQEILAVLKTEAPSAVKVARLIAKANARGGRDNVSVALAEFKEGGA